jgi:C-methyltransferase
MAAHGIFARDGRAYTHTSPSRLLRSDHPMSMRAFPRMNGLPFVWHTFSNLEHSVRTGAPAIETLEPRGLWAYLQDRPDEAQIFSQSMTARAAGDTAAVLAAYDFSGFETIADIGGGRGHLLRAVLDSAPGSRGILFDLPAVIETLEVEHDRLSPQAGDFFVDPLPAADAYVLMEILHDWSDEQCVAILKAIRGAAAPGARVLVVESVLAARGVDAQDHSLDVLMLAVTGGRERTPSELNQLFGEAGFGGCTVIETGSRLRVVDAVAV